jgi:raffinose/stachyose/melibiose transport system permease protein
LTPAALFYVLAVLVTILFSAYISGTRWNINVDMFSRPWIWLSNYKNLFQDEVFLRSILNALIVAAFSILVQIPLAVVIAMVLARIRTVAGLLRNVLFIPVLLSSTVVAQIWRFVYHPDFGVLNQLLRALGLSSLTHPWLGDTSTALVACIAPGIWQWWGYFMLILYGAFRAIPNELYEAAMIDGANEWVIARRISLPIAQQVIKTCVILTVAGSLRVFDTIWVMTKGGPLNATQVPATLVFRYVFMEGRFGYGSGVAVFLVLESLCIALLIQRLYRVPSLEY